MKLKSSLATTNPSKYTQNNFKFDTVISCKKKMVFHVHAYREVDEFASI